LVSHFTKQALEEIATLALKEDRAGDAAAVESALADLRYNDLSRLLGVKVIHISERDTQITDRPKEVNEFVNTWSIEGFYEEGIAPAEMGWGHAREALPRNAFQHAGEGPGNQICLAQMACKTWVRSWVPCGEITGHGDPPRRGLHHLRPPAPVWEDAGPSTGHRALRLLPGGLWPVLVDGTSSRCASSTAGAPAASWATRSVSGQDQLGVLLMGHPYTAWWTAACCRSRRRGALVPHQNATTLQVAASVARARCGG
jgi:homospermidine synthase